MNMQDPLTAKLGPLGGADSQGFSGESVLPTRQITITDAQGNIVYDKRTTDTAKASDSHIRNIKYRRTGEWVDGVAAVEPIPAQVLKNRLLKRWLWIAAVLVVFVGLSVSCGSQLEKQKQRDESAARARILVEQQILEARKPFTATVTLDILNKSGFQKLYNVNTKGDTSCQGVGGYKDLSYDGDSSINGIPGVIVSSELLGESCRLTYRFENIPGAAGTYSLALGWRAPVQLTEEELKAGPARSIGE